MRFLPALFAGLFLAAAPAALAAAPGTESASAENASLAGQYMLMGVREAAAGLELLGDGRFRYGLSYGALDEQAEGNWRREGNRILLTTSPEPRPPEWTLAETEKGEPKQFALLLEGANGRPIRDVEVELRLSDGSIVEARTGTDWLEAPLEAGAVPVAVRFRIPLFDARSPEFAVDLAKGHRLRFRLDPRDLGTRDFRDWPLEIREGALVPPGAPEGQDFRKVRVDD
ncbi:hypothetical protein L6Q21_05620 [Sandaracinobacter sp. RS1-74]|uniref:hypothetical protein n=1 Tax=Sandaracinobacteroides sayramensis TaxID=2913411 RepID=UPI001EDB4492|nr:hypothetical protein [Sandaracinobacteroides sayramensis]MCG2840456.1 hypothetical protein [Sandaracinobacteroides sayramensis]